MKNHISLPTLLLAMLLQQCGQKPQTTQQVITSPATHVAKRDTVAAPVVPADAPTILARQEVPILCYHHIHEWKPGEKSSMKTYIVPPATFRDQIKMLADSGYHTITPEQYNNYLLFGAPLPEKPVMITFDDTDGEQFTIGAAELNKYGFKGVFFIMTIAIGKPRYMSAEELKKLSDDGHVIGAHTWDHHSVKGYQGDDWDIQFKKPKEKLEAITGKPVEYFAYPFGLWNEAAIPELQKRGYKAAFQLAAKRDTTDPLFTLRRMLVPGTWNGAAMQKWMRYNFPQRS